VRRLILAAVFLLPLAPAAPGPVVRAIDPPNWWVPTTRNPLQLLVRGERLAGCTLRSDDPSVEIVRQSVNAAGTYLIAYARLAPAARPGRVALRVDGPNGSAPASIDLVAPLAREGRFAGLSPEDVVYLVMPDRFVDGDPTNNAPNVDRANPHAYHGGDLRGLAARLPYLKQLGVTVVWLTPVYDNDDARPPYHGYHATDFYSVEEHFGSLDDMRALVDAAHRLGIKVMQDQVANHTGPTHPWVTDPPTPTWFNGTAAEHLTNNFKIEALADPAGNPAERRAALEGWFGGKLPDLNQNDADAAAYLIQNSLWWVGRTGVDAIRQDTLPYVPRAYWSEWIAALRAEFPHVTVLGEVFNGDPKVVSFFQGGVAHDGVDSHVDELFDFPLMFALDGYLSQQSGAEKIAEVLAADTRYPNPLGLVPFLGNHDTVRAISALGGDPERLRLAHRILMTMRGMPQIYYGDEIGLAGGEDPDCRRDFPGGFAGDAADAFTARGRTAEQQATFENLRGAIALRRAHPALRGATTKVLVARGPLLVYAREGGGERALVAVNASDVTLYVFDGKPTLILAPRSATVRFEWQ